MRKNFGPKPYSIPQPVHILAAYDEHGIPNAMNVAWAGVIGGRRMAFGLNPDRKTLKNLMARGAFTVSIADVPHMIQCDYLGLVSGNDVPDKLEKIGFHTIKAEFVDAPLIEELPMAVECKFISYDAEKYCLIGEIVNVCADERILKEDGKVDTEKLQALAFDSMNKAYLRVGEKVGNAFRDGKKLME